MQVQQLCTPRVYFCSPRTSVLGAARLMRQHHVGDLVVVDDPDGDQTPLGIITDRDIVIDVLGRDRDPAQVTVHEVMHHPVVVVDGTEDLTQALERMRVHGVRRIPVMGSGRRLHGIISLDDLLRQLALHTTALAAVIEREQSLEQRTVR